MPTISATFSNQLTLHSQKTAVRRCGQDVIGHCEGIVRRVSTTQIVFERYQRIDQALQCASPPSSRSIPPANTTQEYNGVKDKLDDLIPWLEQLLVTLAKADPNNGREEAERRSQLERSVSHLELLVYHKLTLHDRSLDDIGKRSLALSEKGKVARVLDKTRDSQEVINLVEQLRQAIFVYQVSVRDRRQS